jgi:phosphate/sulfate permease
MCLYVLVFEFINGFHDSANAVATVIYTRSLKPRIAVMWSGMWNMFGVLVGWTTVAVGIAKLLPLQALLGWDFAHKIAYFSAIMIAAIARNIYTWYKAIPCSSMHALVWSVVGASMGMVVWGSVSWSSLPWHKLGEIGMSLLLSPVIGGVVTIALLLAITHLFHSRPVKQIPSEAPPPPRIKAVLIATCTAVSFAHGSNDGQKWVGVMMAILVVCLPTTFTLTHIPFWVIGVIGATIGMGTMVGRKKIVKTIGEKIGKHHMTYAQWAAAEIVAASMIAISTYSGLPVSTTHVLSSGIAWSMIATGWIKNLQKWTIHNIVMARLLTLPVTIALGFFVYRISIEYIGLFY